MAHIDAVTGTPLSRDSRYSGVVWTYEIGTIMIGGNDLDSPHPHPGVFWYNLKNTDQIYKPQNWSSFKDPP